MTTDISQQKTLSGYADQVLSTAVTKIYWHSKTILRLDVMNESVVETDHIRQNIETIRQQCQNQPCLVLIDARGTWTISKEAREAATAGTLLKKTDACAFIIDSLAARLIVNFFIREKDLSSACKVFSNENEALQWLGSFAHH